MRTRKLSSLLTVRRGRIIGSAAVLKTAARKGMQVRVLSPPPLLFNVSNRIRRITIEVSFCVEHENWLREKESNLHLRVQSPTCCQLHHPGKTGHGERETRGQRE